MKITLLVLYLREMTLSTLSKNKGTTTFFGTYITDLVQARRDSVPKIFPSWKNFRHRLPEITSELRILGSQFII